MAEQQWRYRVVDRTGVMHLIPAAHVESWIYGYLAGMATTPEQVVEAMRTAKDIVKATPDAAQGRYALLVHYDRASMISYRGIER